MQGERTTSHLSKAVFMPAATLELALSPAPVGSYVTARFAPDDSAAEPAVLARDIPVSFDLGALRAVLIDHGQYGRRLTGQLFASQELRDAWAQARAAQERLLAPLRLRLRLDPRLGALHSVRWEALRDYHRGDALALDERITFARTVDTDSLAPIRQPARPDLSALVAVANPSDLAAFGLAPVDVPGEVGRALAALRPIPVTCIGDAPGRPTTRTTLAAALRDKHQLVSLICHGSLLTDGAYLWLEGEDGKSDRMSGSDFIAMVRALEAPPLLLVLGSCHSSGSGYNETLSSLAPALAGAGLPAVIGFQGEVRMSTVRRLLPVLYAELARDGQIDRAMAAARKAIAAEGDWWQPILWLRVRDGRLWAEPPGAVGYGPVAPPAGEGLAAQLHAQRERVQDLLYQLDRFGRSFAPAHIIGGLREARATIRQLKAQLRTLGAEVDDWPDDT